MLILLLATHTAVAAAGLSLLAGGGWPAALLIAGTAAGAALQLFDSIIE